MSDDEQFSEAANDEMQRWFFGGSPPEADSWPRHAFQDELGGVSDRTARSGRLDPFLATSRGRTGGGGADR